MSDRKNTPDVLADLLNGEIAGEATPADIPVPSPTTRPRAAKRAPAPESKPPRAQPAVSPQRWEHRVASFQQHNGWRLRYLDGVPVKDWATAPALPEYIAAMALEGWQVAGAASGEALFGRLDKYQVFFKRPV